MSEAYQSKYDQRGANIGSNVDIARDNARVQSVLHNYAPEQKQTLAEAAAEIQRLLKQLEETNPTATEAEQKAFINAAIPRTHKERFLNALQQGGKEALKEFLDNSYLNVAIAVIEGWKA
jgi:negative regulator of replication initiation